MEWNTYFINRPFVTINFLFLFSNNRITTQGAMFIAKGLEGNNTLEILKVADYPCKSKLLVLLAVKGNSNFRS